MENKPTILDFETCERIGYEAEESIFTKTKEKLNERHSAKDGMKYDDTLALDLYQSEGLLSDCDTPAKSEVMEILREEYRNLDDLQEHCLFLYLGCGDKDENEMVNDLAWHFEEVLLDRAEEFLAPALRKKRSGFSN